MKVGDIVVWAFEPFTKGIIMQNDEQGMYIHDFGDNRLWQVEEDEVILLSEA